MGVADIDKLQIEIEATSADATKKLDELIDTLGRLKSASTVGGAFGNLKKQISGIGNSADKASKSFGVLKSVIKGLGLRQIASYIGGAVASINEYVETVNLFQVSMGEFYDEAMAYSQLVSDKMGVDPAQWMRSQGVFMSMAKGFGMTKEQAYDLSESLTELSYDIGSLYNEDVESAATRLQSALAGEIEPIRRLGISISQATLQEYALSKGINESVASMTEQEKALLRSLKLIEGAGSIGAIGDFAKTLESPANAIRILKQQFVQLGRAIGSVFLPIVVQVIPYVQALVSVITDMISALATFVGFEIPEWDNKSWDANFSGAADAVDDTTAAVKKLKTATVGIDELNIISPDTGSGAGDGGISGWAAGLEIPDLWNKEMIAAIETEASKLKEKLQPVLDLALKIGAALLALKIADTLYSSLSSAYDWLKKIDGKMDVLSKGRNIVIGATLMITSAVLVWDAIKGAIADQLDWNELAQMIIGSAGFAGGAYLVGAAFGKSMIFGAIGLAAGGGTLFATSFFDGIKNGLSGKNVIGMLLGGAATGAGIGALVAGPVGALFGALIGTTAAGMADLGIIIYQNWEEIQGTAKAIWDAMAEDWGEIVGGIAQAGQTVLDWLNGGWKETWDAVGAYFGELFETWSFAWDEFKTGFGDGWDQFWNDIGEVVDAAINGVITAVESGINWCIDALNSLSWTVPDWVPWAGGNSFGFNIEKVKLGRVDLFADGGFPDHGQMFIANETGPELVGQIGQRTAVANTSQIVDGISIGVRDANAEQNALLMEQNELLRAILAKEGTTYLDGKALKRSLDKAGRSAGANIMAGGVMAR